MAINQGARGEEVGLAQAVRRAISRMVLDLRAALEEDFLRQLTALGVRETGVQPLQGGRPISPPDARAREIAIAVIEREIQAGAGRKAALEAYIRESAFTFLNRAVGLRCLEEHGLLLVDGHPETAIKRDPARNASSLYWRVRNELPPNTAPREVWRETLRRACAAVSQQVRVLFDPDSEYAALLPLQPALERVVGALNAPDIPADSYAQDEFLGWVYQYYNTREKDAVYAKLAKGGKIEQPEELAAATCLYTERYMVDFLLQNSLGALWVEMHPESNLPERWPYYVRPPEGNPKVERPVKPLGEITLLDPACGSGHFLVRAFDLLVDMYHEEGREPEAEIPHLILERNLHGIDIDLRAVQIAALALYIKGCALGSPAFRPRRINLVPADAILPGEAPPREYMARFQGDKELEELVKSIWQGLRNVRDLGSLLHPERAVDAVIQRRRQQERGGFWEHDDIEWHRWKTDLLGGLREEFERQAETDDIGRRLFGKDAAKGVGLVEALGQRYDVVVTNPPYAGSKNLNDRLKQFIQRDYTEGKRDLYAALILRCRDFCLAGGYVGMVTQQSWLFLRSFAALRKDVLKHTTITTLAHLGEHGFEESAAAGAFVALFSVKEAPPTPAHQMSAFRLIGPKSPAGKESLLRLASTNASSALVFTPRQTDFLSIPETPFVYWLKEGLFRLLQYKVRYVDRAFVREGLHTTDNDRFLRFFWEDSNRGNVWFPYLKGGGYRKWYGLNSYAVNWGNDGAEIRATENPIIPSYELYFKPGYTYTDVARGSLGCRYYEAGSIFDAKGPVIIPRNGDLHYLPTLSNARLATYLLRALSPTLQFRSGYVNLLPYPPASEQQQTVSQTGRTCVEIKKKLVSEEAVERTFAMLRAELRADQSILRSYQSSTEVADTLCSLLHQCEGYIERASLDIYGIKREEIQAVLEETGLPAAWHTLLTNYDALPDSSIPVEIPREIVQFQREQERRSLPDAALAALKARLGALYADGQSGTKSAGTDVPLEGEDGPEIHDGPDMPVGAHIPIPAETFLEELSQRLEIHPISVYWLLKEMREQEGLVSPPELKRHLGDYVSVSILRMLGYRWPEQDAYEKEHGPILDPALVDDDGIIPLVPCAEQPTGEQRIRMRLERDFGEQGATQSEQEFRQWIGKSIGEWLRKDFFRRHVQQFKQRPIAWHLVSPERTFEAFVLYHKLSQATLQTLRAKYAGGLIARLKAEQQRARERKEEGRARELQAQIEDVEEFRTRIEAIERGAELKYRIRCRWKGEEAAGRPGPYAPDIDDGVKVNIRPFQEAGLLAVKEVIKKW